MAEDELWKALMRFDREVMTPRLNDLRDELRSEMRGLVTRDEFLIHMNAIYTRLDRLESEYQSIRASLQRLEQRMAAVEEKLDKMALRSELVELKERIAVLEKQLN